MEGRYRFLSCGSTHYGVSHEHTQVLDAGQHIMWTP